MGMRMNYVLLIFLFKHHVAKGSWQQDEDSVHNLFSLLSGLFNSH